LIEFNIIGIFASSLSNFDPKVRTEAGLGLSNLASNPQCVRLLATKEVLNAIRVQFANSDNWRISKQLYWFMTEMVLKGITLDEQNGMAVFMILLEFNLIQRLVDLLSATSEPLLLLNGLNAIAVVCAVLPEQRERIDDLDGVTAIEKLTTFNNSEVQNLSEKIIEEYFPN
jgi:hypothetical protein